MTTYKADVSSFREKMATKTNLHIGEQYERIQP